MKKLNFYIILLLFNFIYDELLTKHYDLTLISIASYGDGLSGVNGGFADVLYKDIKINSPIPTPFLNNMPKHLIKIFSNNNKKAGDVLLYSSVLYNLPEKKYLEKCKIKIAYSMVEGYGVPKEWVTNLNNFFDALVVPDEFLINVYKNCGVNIPIFVLPMCVPLEDLISNNSDTSLHRPFTFGFSGAFVHRKNHKLVLEAFIKVFGNNPNVQLKIHGRKFNSDTICQELKSIVEKNKIQNVQIDDRNLNRQQYVNFLKSLDCYVFLSTGEGFSITPREAMALGIPCILTNHTAHKTLCKTGLVKSIEPYADYLTSFNDACAALNDMWVNFNHYKKLALQSKEWVIQYTAKKLHDKYLNLVKPKKLIFGDKNEITDTFLQTNSLNLYTKYKSMLKL